MGGGSSYQWWTSERRRLAWRSSDGSRHLGEREIAALFCSSYQVPSPLSALISLRCKVQLTICRWPCPAVCVLSPGCPAVRLILPSRLPARPTPFPGRGEKCHWITILNACWYCGKVFNSELIYSPYFIQVTFSPSYLKVGFLNKLKHWYCELWRKWGPVLCWIAAEQVSPVVEASSCPHHDQLRNDAQRPWSAGQAVSVHECSSPRINTGLITLPLPRAINTSARRDALNLSIIARHALILPWVQNSNIHNTLSLYFGCQLL